MPYFYIVQYYTEGLNRPKTVEQGDFEKVLDILSASYPNDNFDPIHEHLLTMKPGDRLVFHGYQIFGIQNVYSTID